MSDNTNSVRYKSLTFLGFPRHRIGNDGSLWSRHRYRNHWVQRGTRPNNQGYPMAQMYYQGTRKDMLVSRIVLMAFVGPCPEGHECCHNDGNPKNNRLANLHWDTHKNNQADRVKHGTANRGERHGMTTLIDEQVREIRKLYATGNYFQRVLAEKYNVCQVTISNIIKRVTWDCVD